MLTSGSSNGISIQQRAILSRETLVTLLFSTCSYEFTRNEIFLEKMEYRFYLLQKCTGQHANFRKHRTPNLTQESFLVNEIFKARTFLESNPLPLNLQSLRMAKIVFALFDQHMEKETFRLSSLSRFSCPPAALHFAKYALLPFNWNFQTDLLQGNDQFVPTQFQTETFPPARTSGNDHEISTGLMRACYPLIRRRERRVSTFHMPAIVGRDNRKMALNRKKHRPTLCDKENGNRLDLFAARSPLSLFLSLLFSSNITK